jgi:hypothetical protein
LPMSGLRSRIIRVAYANPDLRPHLLAVLGQDPTSRSIQASCLVGVSWAWISPEGKAHRVIKGGHVGWAREYFQDHRPDEWAVFMEDSALSDASGDAFRKLLEEGWIRVTSVRDVYVNNPAKVTQRAWHALAEMVAQCLIDEYYDPDKAIMWLEWSNGRRQLSAVTFLEEFGPQGAVDRLFNKLLGLR